MPYINQSDYDNLVKRIKDLEIRVGKNDIFLKKCQGSPEIRGFESKITKLNDDLDVIELKNSIRTKQDAIIDTVKLTVSNKIFFRFRATDTTLYLEKTVDGGDVWITLDSWPV